MTSPSKMVSVDHRDFALVTGRRRLARGGFSLIETGIVLGVVGAIIGSFWTIYTATSDSRNINRMAQVIVSVIDDIRRVVDMRHYPTTVDTTADISGMIESGGYVPADLVQHGELRTPWNGEFNIGLSFYAIGKYINISFETEFADPSNGLNSGQCTAILRGIISKVGSRGELYAVYVYDGVIPTYFYEPFEPMSLTCPDPLVAMELLFYPMGE